MMKLMDLVDVVFFLEHGTKEMEEQTLTSPFFGMDFSEEKQRERFK